MILQSKPLEPMGSKFWLPGGATGAPRLSALGARISKHRGRKKMSDAIPILHMLSPQKHMSPFDVNMAADAGYKVIVPYINVTLEEVTGLTQDAIFSRPPDSGVRTGIFIGGKDALLALDMMDAAKKALVPPFGLSTFADPAGSFTTAAAMVACVERVLRTKFN